MSDVFPKLLAIILSFMLAVLVPVSIKSMMEDMTDRRCIMNEMTTFIDEVVDTGQITESTLEDFLLAVNSYGPVIQVTINRYQKEVNPDGQGGTYVSYVYTEDNRKYNQGDHIKVNCKSLGYSGMQRLIMATTKWVMPAFDCSFDARIR